jgi:hypothetical protein
MLNLYGSVKAIQTRYLNQTAFHFLLPALLAPVVWALQKAKTFLATGQILDYYTGAVLFMVVITPSSRVIVPKGVDFEE